MPSRVGGVLALVAVALLGVALLIPWWSGHPTVDGKDTRLVEVDITLFGGERCNTGGDGACQHLPLVGGFKTFEAIELGAVGAAALLALALATLSLARAAARKGVARFAMAGGGAVMVVGLLLLATGPDIHVSQTVNVPTGFGGFVAMFGGIAAIVASVFARKDDVARPPAFAQQPAMAMPGMQMQQMQQMQMPAMPQPPVFGGAPAGSQTALPPNGYGIPPTGPQQAPMPMPPMPPPMPQMPPQVSQQPYDVQALLRDDSLRPALPPSPGGGLPGPAGPIVPMTAPPSPPLFQSAPQLRPLYEMPGSSGFVPAPLPPPLPTRPPTPVSRAELESDDGLAARSQPRRTSPPPSSPPPLGSPAIALPPLAAPPPLAPSLAASILAPRPNPTQPPPLAPIAAPPRSGATKPPPLSGALPPPRPTQPPPLRATNPTKPPPPGSQGPPGTPNNAARANASSPSSFGAHASTALGVSPLQNVALPTPAAPPAAPPPRVPQPMITSPRNAGVPTPPTVAAQTPPPITLDDDIVKPDDDDDAEHSESSFDGRQTVNASPGSDSAVDNTAPGLGIALEETPAAELLRPDDIETRGLPKMRPSALDITTPVPRKLVEDAIAAAGVAPTQIAPPTTLHTPGPTTDPDHTPAPVTIDEQPADPHDITDDQEPVAPPPRPKIMTPHPEPADPAFASTVMASQSPLPPLPPISTASQKLPPPRALQTPSPSAGPSPACPQCEAPMAWVEEHLRFYCKACKMYF